MFRICLIGCGGMANSGHGPSAELYAKRYSDTELSACCDINPVKAEDFMLRL